MIRDKKIIIGASLLLVGCVILIVSAIVSANHKSAISNTPSKNATADDVYTSLKITNFSSYWGINTATQTAIETGIDHYLDDTKNSASRAGSIRQGSFKRTTDGSTSNTVFLVDIANLKRSYKVSLGSDTATGEMSLYILCPSSSELVYPPFDCKDDLSEQAQ